MSLQVVEKIRAGDGKGKKLLVIDVETEQEMSKRVSVCMECLCGLKADVWEITTG